MPGGMLMPGMFGIEGMGFFAAGLAAGFPGALIACSFGGAPGMVALATADFARAVPALALGPRAVLPGDFVAGVAC